MSSPFITRLNGAVTLLLLAAAGCWLGWLWQPVAVLPPVADTQPPEPVVAPVPKAPQPKPAPPKPQPWHFAGSPASRRTLQVHRYVGTIDGQLATAELQWYTPDSITGFFYQHRRGPEYSLRYAKNHAGPVVLTVGCVTEDCLSDGQWQLQSRPGAAGLQAIWQQAKRRRRVVLHESYAGAVRYGVRTVVYTDDARGSLLHDFFTLPAPATVRAQLRPYLHPGPEARLRQLTQARDSLVYAQRRLLVRLNDYGLFSYQVESQCQSNDEYVVCGGGVGLESFFFDLRSGRPLTVESQLRPGYQKALGRLLGRHLPSDLEDICLSRHFVSQELPNAGMCLTRTGLEGIYEGPAKCGDISIRIPYAELRPLVRPGTPLARMLTARGI